MIWVPQNSEKKDFKDLKTACNQQCMLQEFVAEFFSPLIFSPIPLPNLVGLDGGIKLWNPKKGFQNLYPVEKRGQHLISTLQSKNEMAGRESLKENQAGRESLYLF